LLVFLDKLLAVLLFYHVEQASLTTLRLPPQLCQRPLNFVHLAHFDLLLLLFLEHIRSNHMVEAHRVQLAVVASLFSILGEAVCGGADY